MLPDATQEIEKYHRGPLQIALCLLAGILAKYKTLCRDDPSFQDDEIDAYLRQHVGFVSVFFDLRDSLLHQHYENMPTQKEVATSLRKSFAYLQDEFLPVCEIVGETLNLLGPTRGSPPEFAKRLDAMVTDYLNSPRNL